MVVRFAQDNLAGAGGRPGPLPSMPLFDGCGGFGGERIVMGPASAECCGMGSQ